MRLTPLDIQSHRFPSRVRGYDKGEVDSFMRIVGEDYEAIVKENEALRETVRALESRVARMAGEESRLRETLVTAQALSEDLKQTAIREAEMRVAEAEVRAEKLLDAGHRRAARLQEEIRELRGVRSRVAEEVRSTLESHLRLVDSLLAASPEGPALSSGWIQVTASASADVVLVALPETERSEIAPAASDPTAVACAAAEPPTALACAAAEPPVAVAEPNPAPAPEAFVAAASGEDDEYLLAAPAPA